VRYGLSLMNRWSRGEPDPWSTADWTESWSRSVVNDQEWAALRQALDAEARMWLESIRASRDYSELELSGVIASIAHLAYHFGAIRQIDRSIRGPAARYVDRGAEAGLAVSAPRFWLGAVVRRSGPRTETMWSFDSTKRCP
jgi:hypothetical protein